MEKTTNTVVFFFHYINKVIFLIKRDKIMQDKDKKKYFTAIVSETKEIPRLEVKQVKNCKYLKYGTDNLFPQYVFELYTHSSQFASIVDTMKDYIIGNGIVSGYPMKVVNRKGDTFDLFVEKLIIDYLLFGGFAFQVIRNKNKQIAEINWLDFRYIRINEDEDTIFYNKEWHNNRMQPKVYERYVNGEMQTNSVFYYKGRQTRNQYPEPCYLAALTSIEISTQIPDYHLNNLTNGFHPSAIVNFNNGSNLPEDVMDEIEEAIQEKFSGTKNASRILLSFNDDMTHKTTIERLPDDGSIDIYNSLKESTEKDIYTAFRISKLLMGDASDSTGFNKQAYLESFALYNKTVIQPIQKEIEDVVNNVLGEGSLHFEKFVVDWSETGDNEDNSNIIE